MPKLDTTSMVLKEGQYVKEVFKKDLIVIHHTVGGTARSTYLYWNDQDDRRVATSFLIDRDGTIYQTFDPRYWAYHVAVPGAGSQLEKRSIGIEIASEGGLTQDPETGHLHSFGVVNPKTLFTQPYVTIPGGFRGFTYFDAYEPAQVESLLWLVPQLVKSFGIPKKMPVNTASYAELVTPAFVGVAGHANFRSDKSDPNPSLPWADLSNVILSA